MARGIAVGRARRSDGSEQEMNKMASLTVRELMAELSVLPDYLEVTVTSGEAHFDIESACKTEDNEGDPVVAIRYIP